MPFDEVEVDTQLLSVTVCPHPLKVESKTEIIPVGSTIADLIERYQPDPLLRRHSYVFINDHLILPHNYRLIKPKPGTIISIRMVPGTGGGSGGGKNPLRTVLTIGVAIASMVFAPMLAPAFMTGGAFGMTLGASTALGLSSILIGTAGMLLVNAIAPIRPPKLPNLSGTGQRDSPTLFITGSRNQAMPFGIVPRILGRHRMVPPLGALSYSEIAGPDQFIIGLLVWGEGPVEIEDLKIGETPITDFEDVTLEHRYGYQSDLPHTIYPRAVYEEVFDTLVLERTSTFYDWTVRRSQRDADTLSIDIVFPQGLQYFADDGSRKTLSVTFTLEYSVADANSWTPVETFTVSGATTSAVRVSKKWNVTRGQYDVRIRRESVNRTDNRSVDMSLWTALRTFTNENPLNYPRPLASTAFRIRASEQISGQVNQLNAVVTSVLPDWDTTSQAWVERATNNPASLYRGVLQGNGIAIPLPDSRINITNLQDFHEFCELNGFEFNMVRDFASNAFDTLSDICASARASPIQVDNKWGVVIDRAQSTPVQHFSTRNSYGFNATKQFREIPHGFRIRFINEEKNYQSDERIVYADGYDEDNATLFEGLEFPGVTKPSLIWKHGRFYLAHIILRPEVYNLYSDIEQLVCKKGSLVRVNHDVPLWGLHTGRITGLTVDAGNITAITVDEEITMQEGEQYSVRIRNVNGSIYAPLVETGGVVKILTFIEPIAEASGPQVGDLFMFGRLNQESVELIVLNIQRQDDEVALLSFLDYSPAIYQSDQGAIPPFNSQISDPVGYFVPAIVSVRANDFVLMRDPDGSWKSRILVSIVRPSTIRANVVAVETQYRVVGSVHWSYVANTGPDANEVSIFPVEDRETYDFRLRYVFDDGTRGNWTPIQSIYVAGKTLPPPFVDNFTARMMADGTRQWTFSMNNPPLDIAGFRIRYFSDSDTVPEQSEWEDMLPLMTNNEQIITASPLELNILGAGWYVFGIKAVDTSGNESENAHFVIVSFGLPRLRGIVLNRNEEDLGWPGTKIDCYVDNDNILKPSASLGTVQLNDTFTDADATLLENHVTAGTWSKWTATTQSVTIQGNQVKRNDVAGAATYAVTTSPGSTDYAVEAIVKKTNASTAVGHAGIMARLSPPDDPGGVTGYHFRYDSALQGFTLWILSGTGNVQIGGTFSDPLTTGNSRRMRLVVKNEGTQARIFGYIDGVLRFDGLASVANTFAANHAGLRWSSDSLGTNGIEFDDFVLTVGPLGDWTSLPATWTELEDTWNQISERVIEFSYMTETIDLFADLWGAIFVRPEAFAGETGSPTVSMQIGTDADGGPVGDFIDIGDIQGTRYLKIKVVVSDPDTRNAELRKLNIMVDSQTVTVDHFDIDVASFDEPYFDKVAVGHFMIGDRDNSLAQITSAQITAMHETSGGAGPNYNWLLVSKNRTITTQASDGSQNFVKAAEFKIYDETGAPADAVVDIQLRGPKGGTPVPGPIVQPPPEEPPPPPPPGEEEPPPPPAQNEPVIATVIGTFAGRTNSGNDVVITTTVEVQADHTIFVAIQAHDPSNVASPTVTDSAGNTYVLDRQVVSGSGQTEQDLFRCSNNTALPVGSTITLNNVASPLYSLAAVALKVSGLYLAGSPVLQGGSSQDTATGSLQLSTPSINTEYDSSFIIGLAGLVSTGELTITWNEDAEFTTLARMYAPERILNVATRAATALHTALNYNPSQNTVRRWQAQIQAYRVAGVITPTPTIVNFRVTADKSEIAEDLTEVGTFFIICENLPVGETATITTDGTGRTATSGVDFTPALSTAIGNAATAHPDVTYDVGTGVLTFTGTGSTITLAVSITAVDDAVVEADETVLINLSNATTSISGMTATISDNTQTITIKDSGAGGTPPPPPDYNTLWGTAPTTITDQHINSMTNVFNDDFTAGLTFSEDGTNTPVGKWYPLLCNGARYLNDEIHIYVNLGYNGTDFNPFSIVSHSGKSWLRLSSRRTPADELSVMQNRTIQSGVLSNHRSLKLTYGYFEARIILPSALTSCAGPWPAFWGLYGDPKYSPPITPLWPPEWDALEWVRDGGINRAHVNFHYNLNGAHRGTGGWVSIPGGGNVNGAHLYGVLLTPTYCARYIDRQMVERVFTNSPDNPDTRSRYFHRPMHMIFNLAWGGSWANLVGGAPILSQQPQSFDFTDCNAWRLPVAQ